MAPARNWRRSIDIQGMSFPFYVVVVEAIDSKYNHESYGACAPMMDKTRSVPGGGDVIGLAVADPASSPDRPSGAALPAGRSAWRRQHLYQKCPELLQRGEQ